MLMLKMFAAGAAVAVLALSAGTASGQDVGYGYGYRGYGPGYGAYPAGYGPGAAYGYQPAYGYGNGYGYGYGYGYGSSPYDLPARYCGEEAEFHRQQAWAIDQGAGYDPAWREWNRQAAVDFYYSHPGAWRCAYQGWGGY